MAYHFTKSVSAPFAETVERITAVLAEHGFGVPGRIDLRDTLKKRKGVDFRPYVILGARNPTLALEALSHEDKIGTMPPCNVVVQEKDGAAEKVRAELRAVADAV